MAEGLTRDAFLGGRVHLWQPVKGYRAGVDPVLLAAAVPAQGGESLLDLGCGVGAASLCVGARVPGVRLFGLELQPRYADLARQNAAENSQEFNVLEGDIQAMPQDLKAQFDHVIANPPYYDRSRGSQADEPSRETALGERTPIAAWVEAAARRTRPGGFFHLIQRAERLPDILGPVEAHFGSLRLWPMMPRPGRDSQLVILRARKGGRADFRLHAPLQMHEGSQHDGDRESYCPRIRAVLREGAALEFPG